MSQAAETLPSSFVEQLSEAELPVVAGVLAELKKVLETPVSSAAELAEVILNDAALTAKLLRVSNSVYYNPSSHPINTVSRAVVQLGIAQIKSLCVSAIVLDDFKNAADSPHLLAAIADSVHIAMQAKSFYGLSTHRNVDAEEVVVAGLLRKLGEVAFWSEQRIDDKTLKTFLQTDDIHLEKNQKRILGFSFDDITAQLCEMWSLGEVLEESLEMRLPRVHKEPGNAAMALDLGSKVVTLLSTKNSEEELKEVMSQIAVEYDLSVEETESLITENTGEALKLVSTHGADELCQLIVGGARELGPQQISENNAAEGFNSELLAEVTQELATMGECKVDINTLFHTVLEGLHRAVGLERVAIAMLDKSQQTLQAKYVIGSDQFPWKEKFSLHLKDNPIFERCVRQKKAVVSEEEVTIPNLIGYQGAVMLAPILVGNQILGIYYADCGDQQLVGKDRQLGFSALCAQSNKSLSSILSKR